VTGLNERAGQTLPDEPGTGSPIFSGCEYFTASKRVGFRVRFGDERPLLESLYLLEKAIYELGYELENRPDWAEIPLRALL